MSGTSSEKRRLIALGKSLGSRLATLAKTLCMAARKFGPEDRHLDNGDYMDQIQELQSEQQLSSLGRQSSAADGNGHVIAIWPLRVCRHHGVRPGSPTRFTR
jgi:hypothetical protein